MRRSRAGSSASGYIELVPLELCTPTDWTMDEAMSFVMTGGATAPSSLRFGIGQIGKAFRNEVTPRNYTFRSREFEQMELEFFIKPDEAIEAIHGSVATVPETGHPGEPQPNWGWQAWHQYWVEERVKFYEGIGLSRDTLGFHIQTKEELAHYARACTDILFKFPFSKKDEQGKVKGDELEGIAARSDFDLSQHQRFSGKPQHVFDDELRQAWTKLPKEKQDDLWKRYYENRKRYLTKLGVAEEAATKQATEDAHALAKGNYVPHVIEPSAGVDRLILALIANAYSETTKTDDKGKSETTYVMKFHPRVAPIKVGVELMEAIMILQCVDNSSFSPARTSIREGPGWPASWRSCFNV